MSCLFNSRCGLRRGWMKEKIIQYTLSSEHIQFSKYLSSILLNYNICMYAWMFSCNRVNRDDHSQQVVDDNFRYSLFWSSFLLSFISQHIMKEFIYSRYDEDVKKNQVIILWSYRWKFERERERERKLYESKNSCRNDGWWTVGI